MMLDKPRPEYLNDDFQESVEALDRAIQKTRLVRSIEELSRSAKTPSHEEPIQLNVGIMNFREQIRLFDKD